MAQIALHESLGEKNEINKLLVNITNRIPNPILLKIQ